jgi:carbon-monoxide dehydrogenase small subunit
MLLRRGAFAQNRRLPGEPIEALMHLRCTVNGTPFDGEVEPNLLLVDLLRRRLALTGTHVGCDSSQCGACTVLVGGEAVRSCSVLAVQAQGAAVTTIEGLTAGQALHPLQQAFIDCHGLQCGFCTPGMVMAAAALLAEHPAPTREQIAEGLEGNLCRCTGYVNIVAAVEQAAAVMSGAKEAA